MKYMLLIYENPGNREKMFNTEEGARLMEGMNALMAEMRERGELVGGEALADPTNTITVSKADDGSAIVTDAPLAEAKEHFGGYLIMDVESRERAVEVASRWPGGPFELRPLMTDNGDDV